ncbi:hypothetical protein QUF80_10125 [Desulfococcaceae bacterium HSG8]|nr:hypothetical protein [Desulfococcaceae bacterium HSG8]
MTNPSPRVRICQSEPSRRCPENGCLFGVQPACCSRGIDKSPAGFGFVNPNRAAEGSSQFPGTG